MIKNYFKIALRNLRKHKTFSIINIAGLSISLAIVILIALFAEMELSMNKFHKNYNYIYKVGNGMIPAPIADIIKLNLPEIKKVARIESFRTTSVTMKYGKKVLTVKNLIFSDQDFFDIFTFPKISGNIKTALKDPMSLVLTESEAIRFFGNEDPINKIVKLDNEFDLTVKAVIKDIPENSSMQFSSIASFISIKKMTGNANNDPFNWWNRNYETYLLSPKKINRAELQAKVEPVLKKNIPKDVLNLNTDLYPLKEIYYSSGISAFHSHGSVEKSFTLISIAILILLIAIINFINLSTARASMRTKEMGIRKTIGAARFNLIKQFLSESILMSSISTIFAVLIASELLPIFNELVGLQIQIFPDAVFTRILIIATAAFLIGILSGIYPAFYLSSFTPGLILRGEIHHGHGKAYLRRILIIFQFAIAVVLIFSTLIIEKQIEFIRNKPLGFQKENIIYFPLNKEIGEKEDLFKSRMMQHSAVKDFAYSFAAPGDMGMVWGQQLKYEGKEFQVWFHAVPISCNFIKLMNMKMAEGREFIDKDENDIANVIVNQAFANEYGLKEPLNARFISMGKNKGKIVGVVKDFNFESLHSKVTPLAFFNFPGYYGCGLIKIGASNYNDIKGVIDYLKSVWRKISPDFPLEYNFLDDRLNTQYKSDERFENAFLGFSLFAILISCLGLFGLSAFTVEQKIKEIGIRKILGASVSSITLMISKKFIALVLLSNLIAYPVGYFIIKNWLKNFAYRIDISWWIFVLSGVIAIVIAILTVSVQAVKAAVGNPIESLRYE